MERPARPRPIDDFIVTQHGGGIYGISAPPMRFRQYLVLGSEQALLIDSGFGMGSLKGVVSGITSLPVTLICTHGHPDHCGGNAEFSGALLHPADAELFAQKCSLASRAAEAERWRIPGAADKLLPTPKAPLPLEDGHIFDLGGRRLRVIHAPGHTRGSVCVLDEASGSLFAGDNIMDFAVALTEPCAATVAEYRDTLMKLDAPPISAVYTGHSDSALPPQRIGGLIRCADMILSGERGEYEVTPMGERYTVCCEGAAISFAPDKV